ncbi:hypothetical protein [Micromonospora sp. DT62]|uniref:hypothetical protein n=1 Tax=Micromonospora sp. DT62 TaxID=3416521 RepID=UPI003CFA307F
MNHRLKAPFVGLVALVLAVGGWFTYQQLRPAQTHPVSVSFAFDTTNRAKVAGYADAVVVGTVTGVAEVRQGERGAPHTIFKVAVSDRLKGDVEDTILVDQLGGTRGKDTWTVEGVQQLAVGSAYVLPLTSRNGSDEHVLVLTPTLAPVTTSGASVHVWTQAVANQDTTVS